MLARCSAPLAAAALLVALCVSCAEEREPRPAPEHVLLLVVDTLRADHLHAWGHERETSPNLDALAEAGVRFSRAVSQCSWTAPSMVSLMTGRYLSEDRLGIPPDVTTLAEIFQGAGYATAAFISNPLLNDEAGFHRGFDGARHIAPYQPDDPIVAWIEGQAGERTFTYVHLNEPHDPYEPPPGYEVWLADPPPLAEERIELYRRLAPELVREDELEQIRRSIAGYDDDILYTDARIGKFVDALRRTGQLERSAIVVTADHGEGLWTRLDFQNNGPRAKRAREGQPPTLGTSFKMTHGNQVHTELVHIPLILVAPGLGDAGRGNVFEGRVENVDVVPTLLELCNLPDPGGLQGTSLLRALEDPAGWIDHKQVVYSATRFVWSVITQDGWQLMVPTPLGECQEGLVVELYDLNRDPEARHNVVLEHPARLAQLEPLLRERQASGLPGHFAPTEKSLEALRALGYVDSGTVDAMQTEFLELSTAELLEKLAMLENGCTVRMLAARALALRENLSASEAGQLEALLEKETAPGVLRAFGR